MGLDDRIWYMDEIMRYASHGDDDLVRKVNVCVHVSWWSSCNADGLAYGEVHSGAISRTSKRSSQIH